MAAIPLLRDRIAECEAGGIRLLCCPEAFLGGLADYAQDPYALSLSLAEGTLAEALSPLASDSVTLVVGFSEVSSSGRLYNSAAVFHRGSVLGVYRKRHPAIRRSVYHPGRQLPLFAVGDLAFGILICNDSNFPEDARALVVEGAELLLVLSNNGLPREKADVVEHAHAVDVDIARENRVPVVRADVAGTAGGRVAYGTSKIVADSGEVLRQARRFKEELIFADLV